MDRAAVLAKTLRASSTQTRKVGSEIEVPKDAFAVLPISNVFECVTNKVVELLNATKRNLSCTTQQLVCK